MSERIKKLRKSLGLTLEKFGAQLGVGKTAVSKWEHGENKVPEQMLKLICREFNVDYTWLTTGEGDMFLPPEDEVGILVSQLIDDKDNPSFNIILETMRAFIQLSPENQAIVADFLQNLSNNSQNKKES